MKAIEHRNGVTQSIEKLNQDNDDNNNNNNNNNKIVTKHIYAGWPFSYKNCYQRIQFNLNTMKAILFIYMCIYIYIYIYIYGTTQH